MSDRPFLGSAAVSDGRLTPADLRSSRFQQVFRDVYVTADRQADLTLRSQAAHLLLPEQGVLGGHSAAALLGAGCSPENAPAEVIVPRGDIAKRRGLVVRQAQLSPTEICEVGGCRLTTPFRTAWDLGRRLRLTEAVVAVDTLARVGRFDPRTLLGGPPGARGCRQLREAVALANPLAESAMETRLRLLLVQAGLPPPVPQFRIVDRQGVVIARVDLAYPEVQLALEYDGGSHFDEKQRRLDLNRDLRLGDLGWHTMRFTSADVLLTPQETARRVRNRLTRHLEPSRTKLS